MNPPVSEPVAIPVISSKYLLSSVLPFLESLNSETFYKFMSCLSRNLEKPIGVQLFYLKASY